MFGARMRELEETTTYPLVQRFFKCWHRKVRNAPPSHTRSLAQCERCEYLQHMVTESAPPLLTTEQVILWRDERAEIAGQIDGLQEKLSTLDRKLEAVALLLPDLARLLLRDPTEPPEKPLHERAWTDIVLALANGERGGRTARWFREAVSADPLLAERHAASLTGLHNALSRLALRGELLKRGNLYYSPETLKMIEAGDLEEVEEEGETHSIASMLNEIIAKHPQGITAGDMVAEARSHPALAAKAEGGTAFVYSFLSREVFRNRLIKDGDVYHFPSNRDGAPPAKASSAPTEGEGATSPIKRGGDFNDLLG